MPPTPRHSQWSHAVKVYIHLIDDWSFTYGQEYIKQKGNFLHYCPTYCPFIRCTWRRHSPNDGKMTNMSTCHEYRDRTITIVRDVPHKHFFRAKAGELRSIHRTRDLGATSTVLFRTCIVHNEHLIKLRNLFRKWPAISITLILLL